MIIYVLHDPRLPDSYWQACSDELQRQGITQYQVHFPVQCPGDWSVAHCINASHKNLVALAKFHNLEEVCIMESDVMFPAEDGWEWFLRNKPRFYDLYLGGTYGEFMLMSDGETNVVQRPAGFHCYMIHSSYYDRFLSTPDDSHIDDAQTGGIYKVCYPFAALQRPGYSSNAKKEVNYNHDLFNNRKQDVYGW